MNVWARRERGRRERREKGGEREKSELVSFAPHSPPYYFKTSLSPESILWLNSDQLASSSQVRSSFFLFLRFLIFFKILCTLVLCLPICLCEDPLEMELKTVVNCHVDVGN